MSKFIEHVSKAGGRPSVTYLDRDRAGVRFTPQCVDGQPSVFLVSNSSIGVEIRTEDIPELIDHLQSLANYARRSPLRKTEGQS